MEWEAKNTQRDLVLRVLGFVVFLAIASGGYVLDAPGGFVAASAGSATGWAFAVLYRAYQLRKARRNSTPPRASQ